jgi:hypothetical protein
VAVELGARVDLGDGVGSITEVGAGVGIPYGVVVMRTEDGVAELTLQLVLTRKNASNSTGGTILFKLYILKMGGPFWLAFARGRLYHITPVPHNTKTSL